MNWKRAWIIVAGLLVIVAGVFLWRNNLSAAFVIAALGACAWFLSYRAQLRELAGNESSEDELADEDPDEN